MTTREISAYAKANDEWTKKGKFIPPVEQSRQQEHKQLLNNNEKYIDGKESRVEDPQLVARVPVVILGVAVVVQGCKNIPRKGDHHTVFKTFFALGEEKHDGVESGLQ